MMLGKKKEDSKMYKEGCGFRKINVCSFKEEDCNPEKCDMYNLEFNSKSLIAERKKVEKELKLLIKDNISIKKTKQMIKLEKSDGQAEEIIQYKKNLNKIADLGKGVEYLNKAITYCKRIKKWDS